VINTTSSYDAAPAEDAPGDKFSCPGRNDLRESAFKKEMHMYRLNSALRIFLVICAFAFTSMAQGSGFTMVGGRDGTAAQTGSGTALGGGGIIGGELNQSSPSMMSDPVGGSQPHTNVSTELGLSFIISLLTNGMPLTGF